MLNQVIIVGRLVDKPEVIETESGKKRCAITLAVSRSYKNTDGVYETDFIDCILWEGIAQNTTEYCNKGDVIGVRGRIETYINEDKKKITQIVADKVTFLSQKKQEE